jgi:hypothetical protein
VVVTSTRASTGPLEVPTEDSSTLVEQVSLLITRTMSGRGIIPQGQRVAGGAIGADFVGSKTLGAGWHGLSIAKGTLPFVVVAVTALW